MQGRKPKPVEQKRLEGNPGKRPMPHPVIVEGRDAPPAPDQMPSHARSLWNEVVPGLVRVGLIDIVDRPALEAMCIQYDRAMRAKAVIAEDGMFALGSMGQLVEHPAIKIEREAQAAFLRFAEHYALTPIARTRLGLAELARRSLSEELRDRIGNNPRRV